jgi:SAM-dependent methyltransferase
MLVSARTLDEYRAMFALTEKDLAGRILDCPGGAAGFTAGAPDAVAVDPAYALPADEFARLALADAERTGEWVAAHPERYAWTYFTGVQHLRRTRLVAARSCLEHRERAPERYLAAALPHLPFPDGAFDLVLSSHLLFTYADRLDRAFHLAALDELRRVSRGEVRVFPLLDYDGARQTWITDQRLGEVRRVAYEFQRGAVEMLVLSSSATSRFGSTAR